ncbi:hypothetical protein ABPG72_000900 [Tetrahymena utriculariae]
MNLAVKDSGNINNAGSLFLTAASTNEQNTIDSIKNSKAKMLFIKLAQQNLQTSMNSDTIQPQIPMTLEQRIIQAQKQLRLLQDQINLNSPRTTQAIHKLRLLPDAFKLKCEYEIEKIYRHNLKKTQNQSCDEKINLYFDSLEQDSDQDTEKFSNNSRKRFYKHLKELISRYESAKAERQQIIKEENDNLRSTVYESGFQFKKPKKREPLEVVNFEYKLQQLNQKKQKQLEVIDKQTSIIFENEFKYRQWQQKDEFKNTQSQMLFDTHYKKKIKHFKQIQEKKQKRFQESVEKQQLIQSKKLQKLQKDLEKRDEKFQTFFSSRFDTLPDRLKEKEQQKLETLHRNQSIAQQKDDFKLHLLKMKQDERDRQGSQLVQELINDKKKELKLKNDSKSVKIQKAAQIENERNNIKLNSYLEKIENVNLRMSLRDQEFKKLLEQHKKKQKEKLTKYEYRVDKLDEMMEKQNEKLNEKDEKRIEQARRSLEVRDLESLRKGDLLQQRLDYNADNQNENWMKKQRINDLIMQRHKKLKERAQRIQKQRDMLQEISMKNTLKLNTIRQQLDYNLQYMKNDPIELLYLKFKSLNLSDELLDRFIQNQNEDEEISQDEIKNAEKENPKQNQISKSQEFKFALDQEQIKKLQTKIDDGKYSTTSVFKSIK